MKEINIKKSLILLSSMFLLILLISFISAQGNAICCERLKNEGAWCLDVAADKCDIENYKWQTTSCESTSFCSMGTCIDPYDGTCTETTKTVCEKDGGYWEDKPEGEVLSCQLGCCSVLDGAFLTTQNKCKEFSLKNGLSKTKFRPDVTNELECILSSNKKEEGACVRESSETAERTCARTTRENCKESEDTSDKVTFHSGRLCSDPNLYTNCGMSEQTACSEDEVHFLDTCGNLANIYDSSKAKDIDYWSRIYEKEDSCNFEGDNVNSITCGNCNYFSDRDTRGSKCKQVQRGDPIQPKLGNHICGDLSCEYDSDGDGVKEIYYHGETWCGLGKDVLNLVDQGKAKNDISNGDYGYLMSIKGQSKINQALSEMKQGSSSSTNTQGRRKYQDPKKYNLPGTTYKKLFCNYGEVTETDCSPERQKVCVVSSTTVGEREAFCKINRFQSCYEQDNEEDCIDRNNRDCYWVQGIYQQIFNLEAEELMQTTGNKNTGYCVPLFTPAFKFYSDDNAEEEEESNIANYCGLGTIKCDYQISKSIAYGKEVDKGKSCVDENGRVLDSWAKALEQRCMAIGDCGPKNNYLGKEGKIQKFIRKTVGYKNGDEYKDGKEWQVKLSSGKIYTGGRV